MTTPSDKYPDKDSGKTTAEEDRSGQETRGEKTATASPSAKPAGMMQGLPLYMAVPRVPLQPESADRGGASVTPPPGAPAQSPSRPAIQDEEPSDRGRKDGADGGETASSSSPEDFYHQRKWSATQNSGPAISVDPDGNASQLEDDSQGDASRRPHATDDGSPHTDTDWAYTRSEPVDSTAFPEKEAASPTPQPSDAKAKEKQGGWLGRSKERKAGKSAAKPAAPKEAPKKYPPFAASHPILGVEQSAPPSVGSRLFSVLALSPLIVLTVMLLLQTIFSLDPRALWFSDEIRHAEAFKNMLHSGNWLILEMNGAPYPDKPPLYFWFLRGLYELLRTDGPLLHFTAVAISGLLFLWASVGLGRQVARVDGRTNLAAGIILLSTGYFMGLLHYARMDLLFSALILGSHVALYRAFVSPKQDFPGMVAAFVLAGLACLVKGPLAFAFPLCAIVLFALWRGTRDQMRCVIISVMAVLFGLLPGLFGLDLLQLLGLNAPTITNPISGNIILALEWSLVFLAPALLIALLLFQFAPKLRICAALSLLLMAAVYFLNGSTPYFSWPLLFTLPAAALGLFALWQATPQRFFRLDFFVGLVAGLLVPALWLGAIYMQDGNPDFILNSLLKTQVLERAVDTFHHKEPWHYYLFRLPLMLLPWVILVFFLPWNRLIGKDSREAIVASRQPEKEGLAYLWCMILSALIMLSMLSGKILIYMLPVLPAFAILAARAILSLSGGKARFFRYGMAIVMFLFGALTIIGALMLFDVLPMPAFDFVPAWKMESHGGFFVTAAIAFVIAGLLWFGLSSSRPEGVLLYMALGCTLLGFPLASLVAPSFDPVLSPKDQALIMRAYINEGYTPASYKVYGGTYSFYTGSVINELKKQDDILPLAEKGKLVLGMRASLFDEWKDAPACLTEVHRQWIETKEYVLLACPPIEGLKPAPAPYTESPDLIREAFRQIGVELPSLPGASVKPAEQKIVRRGQTAPETEKAPAEQAPAEQIPSDQPPAEQAPADKPQEGASPAAPDSPETGDGPAVDKAAPVDTPTPAPEAKEGESTAPGEAAVPDEPAKAPAEAPAGDGGGASSPDAPAEAPAGDTEAPATPAEDGKEAPAAQAADGQAEPDKAPASAASPQQDKTEGGSAATEGSPTAPPADVQAPAEQTQESPATEDKAVDSAPPARQEQPTEQAAP